MNDINKLIDGLDQAPGRVELVRDLQRILRGMAYYLSQSEGVVLDAREDWHREYQEALYAEAGAATQAQARGSAASGRLRSDHSWPAYHSPSGGQSQPYPPQGGSYSSARRGARR